MLTGTGVVFVTAINPNWPLVTINADFTQGPPNVPGVNQMSLNAPARRTTVRQIQTQRGRQYELDQTQAGTATLTIADPLEYLHPANTASPFNTGGNTITSYRGVQVGAWWNAATGDLTGNLANSANQIPGQPWLGGLGVAAPYGYDPECEGWSVHQRSSPSGTSLVSGLPTTALNANTGFETGISPWVASFCTAIQSSTQKHSGSFSARIVPDGTDPVNDFASELVTVVAGRQYTVTAWVWVTTAVTSRCDVAVGWFDSGVNSLGASIATAVSIPAATWTQVTATFTAPAGVATGQIHVQMQGTQPASNIFYVDDVSLVNFAYPVDSSYQVWAITLNSTSDWSGWRPRYIPGLTYTVQVDVWAPTGFPVSLVWNGIGGLVSTSITGNNAYQTMVLSFTPSSTDTANGKHWFLEQGTGTWSTYPVTIYVSKILTVGPVAGWVTAGSPVMSYTPVNPLSGNYSLACAMTTTSDTVSLPLPTAPGYTYTFSAYVYVQNTGTGLGATQTILGSSLPSTVVGSYQRLVHTFTATDAVTMVTWKATSTPLPAVIYLDQLQLELASSASAFTLAGPTFNPLYTGYIERFPLQWDMHGTRGLRPLTCVDGLATLSRIQVTQSYPATVLADGPSAYAPLDDAALPQTVQLPQGGFLLRGYTSIAGVGQGQVSFAGGTFLDGTPCVSVSQQNVNPPTSGDSAQVTYLATSNGGVPCNPNGFTVEVWYQVTSGTPYFGVAAMEPGESLATEAAGPNQWVGWYTSGGRLFGHRSDAAGASFLSGLPGTTGYPDGNWHYQAIVLLNGNQYHFYGDGVGGGVGTISPAPILLSLDNFSIDATTAFGDVQTVVAVANMATYNYALTDTQLAAHYQRGIGYLGELSGARVLRLLELYWGNNVTVGAGFRAMAADYGYSNRFLLDILQEIQETERGLVYVDRYGTVTFDDSTSRYLNYPVSVATFGENPAGASPTEYPYADIAEDFDPTYTFSQTALTRPGNNNFPPQPQPLPTNPPYGQRILTQEVQVNTDFDLYQISTFYLSRYSSPTIRIDTIVLNLAANPAMIGVVLGLEIGARITVKRRTSAGLTTTGDFCVEQISHTINMDASSWTVTLQCSPVFAANAWILGDPVFGVLGSTTVAVY